MLQKMINFFKDEEGATMVEYALMAALIAAFCVAAVRVVGTNVNTTFNTAADRIAGP